MLNLLALALPIVILQIYDRVLPNQAIPTLVLLLSGMAVVLVLHGLLELGRTYLASRTAAAMQHAAGLEAVTSLFEADLAAFESQGPGVQLERLRGIEKVQHFRAGQAALLVVDFPFALLFLALIGLIAGKLALMPAALLALLTVAALWSGRYLRSALEQRSETDERKYNFVIEVLRTMQTIKALGLESFMFRRYERLQAAAGAASYWVTFFSSLARSIGGLFSLLTAVVVAGYGSTLVLEGSLSVGGLAACTFLAGRAAQPVLRTLGIWTQFQNVQIAREQIKGIHAMPAETAHEAKAIGEIQGRLALRNVGFQFDDAVEPLFRNIKLCIEPGETIGIAGANGSGKSTLLMLMMGVIKPTEGGILIDGLDLRKVDAASLRGQICYLPQNGVLFKGTILENLTMFRGEQHASRALNLAHRLGLDDVIGHLPRGYETNVDDGSLEFLPGGVRQRIAVARALALVERPRLILFDEANTFLDGRSDVLLRKVLAGYCGDASMVLVSHRPSYVNLASRKYVLRNGTLEEGEAVSVSAGDGAARSRGGARDALDHLERELAS